FWRVFGFVDNPVLGTLPVIAAGAFATGLFRIFARTTVSVGTDGIEIRRLLRTRFIPLDDVRDVRADAKALHVSLVNGETLSLAGAAPIEPVGNFGASDIGMERGLLGDRIVEALRAQTARRADAAAAIAVLTRDARTSREWLDGLRALAAGASDYRTNVVRLEDLQRVIADPAADADVRVGAAVALRIVEGSAATERIRVAATATAAPDLRGALEAIADSTDDGLEAHLATLS
ncbi:MAG TPA: PH domain-containing protein, partial [Labilithrix sp.]